MWKISLTSIQAVGCGRGHTLTNKKSFFSLSQSERIKLASLPHPTTRMFQKHWANIPFLKSYLYTISCSCCEIKGVYSYQRFYPTLVQEFRSECVKMLSVDIPHRSSTSSFAKKGSIEPHVIRWLSVHQQCDHPAGRQSQLFCPLLWRHGRLDAPRRRRHCDISQLITRVVIYQLFWPLALSL